MEFLDVIEKRRSIRKYVDQAVEREKLLELIRLATLAPSAHNRQPWKFLIATGEEKREIVLLMKDFTLDKEGYKTVPFTADVIEEADQLLLVFKEKDDVWHDLDLLSIGASIEHICLGAVSMGLGSVWINDTDCVKESIADLVGYSSLELVSCIAIGYPNQDPKPRPRKDIGDILL